MNETQQIDWEKYLQEYLQENGQSQEQLALVKINKLFFRAFCEKHNISRVTAMFDGCGDSGQLDDYRCFMDDNTEMDIPTDKTEMIENKHKLVNGKQINVFEKVEKSFDYLIDFFAYTILQSFHSGWEINDGSFGTVIINNDGTGKILYNERVTEINYSENNF